MRSCGSIMLCIIPGSQAFSCFWDVWYLAFVGVPRLAHTRLSDQTDYLPGATVYPCSTRLEQDELLLPSWRACSTWSSQASGTANRAMPPCDVIWVRKPEAVYYLSEEA